MESNVVEVSSWWALLPFAIVIFIIWLYKTIKIYRDPEFRFSQMSGMPYKLVKEYQKAWEDIKEANRTAGRYNKEKANEIISNLSNINGWIYYSQWKLEEQNKKFMKALEDPDWIFKDLSKL